MATQGERLAKLEQWKEDLAPMLEDFNKKLDHIDDTISNGLFADIKEVSNKLDQHLEVFEKREDKKEKKKDFWLYFIRSIMISGALFLISATCVFLWGLLSGSFQRIIEALVKTM